MLDKWAHLQGIDVIKSSMHRIDLFKFVSEEIIIIKCIHTQEREDKPKSWNNFATFVEMSFSAHIFTCSSLTKAPLTSILWAALRPEATKVSHEFCKSLIYISFTGSSKKVPFQSEYNKVIWVSKLKFFFTNGFPTENPGNPKSSVGKLFMVKQHWV